MRPLPDRWSRRFFLVQTEQLGEFATVLTGYLKHPHTKDFFIVDCAGAFSPCLNSRVQALSVAQNLRLRIWVAQSRSAIRQNLTEGRSSPMRGSCAQIEAA